MSGRPPPLAPTWAPTEAQHVARVQLTRERLADACDQANLGTDVSENHDRVAEPVPQRVQGRRQGVGLALP